MKKKIKRIPKRDTRAVNFARWRLDWFSERLNKWSAHARCYELFMNWEDLRLNISSEEERKYYNE